MCQKFWYQISLGPWSFKLLFFSPLKCFSGLLFLLFSFYLLSAFFVLGLFMYNFMWFIKLRAWAGMCEGVHRCLQVCLGMHGCVRVCVGEHWCARICFGMHRCALVCRCVWGYVQVYAGMHGCARVRVGCIFRISSGD